MPIHYLITVQFSHTAHGDKTSWELKVLGTGLSCIIHCSDALHRIRGSRSSQELLQLYCRLAVVHSATIKRIPSVAMDLAIRLQAPVRKGITSSVKLSCRPQGTFVIQLS